jgi:hypothetical protein
MFASGNYELVTHNPKRSDNYFLEFRDKNDNINNCKEKRICCVRECSRFLRVDVICP